MRRLVFVLASALTWSLAAPAYAADVGVAPAPVAADNPWANTDVLVDLGGGAMVIPKFEGSRNTEVQPWPFGQARLLVNPFTGERSSPDWFDDRGFQFTPAFRYVGNRNGSDIGYPGLGDVKSALEVGGRIEYRFPNVSIFAEGRQGFGGHHGFIADLGVDILMRPTARTELTFGPRVSFATSSYMNTYFGVSPYQSFATGLPEYHIGSGLRSAGLQATSAYWLTDRWALRANASWTRFLGDIPDSPIIGAVGDVNQYTFTLGLSYRFGYTWPGQFK